MESEPLGHAPTANGWPTPLTVNGDRAPATCVVTRGDADRYGHTTAVPALDSSGTPQDMTGGRGGAPTHAYPAEAGCHTNTVFASHAVQLEPAHPTQWAGQGEGDGDGDGVTVTVAEGVTDTPDVPLCEGGAVGDTVTEGNGVTEGSGESVDDAVTEGDEVSVGLPLADWLPEEGGDGVTDWGVMLWLDDTDEETDRLPLANGDNPRVTLTVPVTDSVSD